MEVVLNGQVHPIDEQATVAMLLEQLELPLQQVAVEVNLELVPRGSYAQTVLSPGDRLEVVTLVGGG